MEGGRLVLLREEPERKGEMARWFHGRWGIPLEAYEESMAQCLEGKSAVPQWYLLLEGETIIAGAGVIENDFHDRPDLRPNLCALYVEPPYRGRGLARALLNAVRADMGTLGEGRLYLVTDHVGFYEKCGWEFLTLVQDTEGAPERMYTAKTLLKAFQTGESCV